MVNLGYDIFVSFDISSRSFDILSRSFDILFLTYGWCGMTPEFQINEHATTHLLQEPRFAPCLGL